MTKEEFSEKLAVLNKESEDLRSKLVKVRERMVELYNKYVAEYPYLIEVGSKVRIKATYTLGGTNKTINKEVVAFVADNKIMESYNWDYSNIYEDEAIGTKLLKAKKNGLPSERIERVRGKVVEIEILN